MKLRGPQSLNGLILVGFGLVALPLLVAVIWALVNLDRLAKQSEQLVISGVSGAENNRQLVDQVASLERLSRQYQVLRNADSLTILQQDLASVQATLVSIKPLAEQADALTLVGSVGVTARRIVYTLLQAEDDPGKAQIAIADFAKLRQRVARLTTVLSSHIEMELSSLQESTRRAQREVGQGQHLVPGLPGAE